MNQIITYHKDVIKLPSWQRWEIDVYDDNGIFRKRRKISFSQFPQACYLGHRGDRFAFDLYGLNGQEFPLRAYCIIVTTNKK